MAAGHRVPSPETDIATAAISGETFLLPVDFDIVERLADELIAIHPSSI